MSFLTGLLIGRVLRQQKDQQSVEAQLAALRAQLARLQVGEPPTDEERPKPKPVSVRK